MMNSDGGEDRTPDNRLMSPALYQLSYPVMIRKGGHYNTMFSFRELRIAGFSQEVSPVLR